MIKLAGRLLMGIAVIHLVLALSGTLGFWQGVAAEGFWNTVRPPWQRELLDRQLDFWVVVGGFAIPLFILGYLITWLAARNLPLPRALGWSLLAFALLASILAPVSGFWFIIIPAIMLLLQSRQQPVQQA